MKNKPTWRGSRGACRVFEGAFAHLARLLLELLDGTLVNSATFVDEMAGGGGFAGVDVADHDDGNVNLLLPHGDWSESETNRKINQ